MADNKTIKNDDKSGGKHAVPEVYAPKKRKRKRKR